MTNQTLALAYIIRRLDQGLYRTIGARLRATETITYSQLVVLAAINVLAHPTPADIAAYLYQAKPSVLPHIRFSAERGYIEQVADYRHARESVLFLSELGGQVLESATRSCIDTLDHIQRPGEVWDNQLQWLQRIDARLSRHNFPSHLL